jgi:putative ABC transport system ATP-binding protein
MESLHAGSGSDRNEGPDDNPTASVLDESATQPTSAAISVRDLNFFYDEAGHPRQVLFDIDLDIWPGEVALLTGPSGCGKTTLLTLIGGLRTVQSGQLHVLGRALHGRGTAELTEARRHIGFISQMHNLLDFLTARQNVQMALQLHTELTREEMAARAGRMLDLVGLGRHVGSYPAHMSGGQKQRVSIARALAGHPELVARQI